jgi:hypothetical protein
MANRGGMGWDGMAISSRSICSAWVRCCEKLGAKVAVRNAVYSEKSIMKPHVTNGRQFPFWHASVSNNERLPNLTGHRRRRGRRGEGFLLGRRRLIAEDALQIVDLGFHGFHRATKECVLCA